MCIFFASDIHGSPDGLRLLWRQAEIRHPRQIVLLGDLLYHGPRNALPDDYSTRSTAELLNQRAGEIVAVRGNCDAEVDQMMLRFPMMADYAVLVLDQFKFYLCHGHHTSPDNPPPIGAADVLATGHTHIPSLQRLNSLVCFNPGSLSLPKGGYPPSFGVYDNGRLSILNLHTLDPIAELRLTT
ncbi:MAG: phosphodiesterase [Victivallales bacterium]|nr:phosphodiesterase [Victivallales bacterium]